jgi:hypothetical protein
MTQEYAAVQALAGQVLATPGLSDADRATLLEQQVEPRVAALLDEWEGFVAQDELVAKTHAVALSALRTSALKYRTLVAALQASDPAGLEQAAQLGVTETGLWNQWAQWQALLAES